MIQNSLDILHQLHRKNNRFRNKRSPIDIVELAKLKSSKTKKKEISFTKEYLFGTEANISSIILITFSNTNTRITFLNASGQVLFSQSSGSVGLKGSQKTNRKLSVHRLLASLFRNKSSFLQFPHSPVALHLKNVQSHLNLSVGIASKYFVIGSLKVYNCVPFNGCRKKKVRRKKSSRVIRR